MTEIQRTTSLLVSLLIIACIGLVLLRGPVFEGFSVTPGSTSRCGVQLGGCNTSGTRCRKGYCESTAIPNLSTESGLPVFP